MHPKVIVPNVSAATRTSTAVPRSPRPPFPAQSSAFPSLCMIRQGEHRLPTVCQFGFSKEPCTYTILPSRKARPEFERFSACCGPMTKCNPNHPFLSALFLPFARHHSCVEFQQSSKIVLSLAVPAVGEPCTSSEVPRIPPAILCADVVADSRLMMETTGSVANLKMLR